ncbi:MAG: YbaB/EbfC family nucleoid-associated protein [Kiritimatiellaeota bacterium]|nr:YbaB/EbfC family nucleoid-associated protein [Kiritimatiellota bacterium]
MGMFDQVKQAMQMRKDAKRIQSEIEAITAEYSNGGITCLMRGDFTVLSFKVAPEVLKEVASGKPERFATMLTNVVNGTTKQIRQRTQELTMKMMQSGDLNAMLGG